MAARERRKRPKRGVASLQPVIIRDEIDLDEADEEEAAQQPHRCIFEDCPYAQVAFPGWVAKQSLVMHINNVHLASGCMPTEQMLQCLGRAICYRCKVLMTSRGCTHCNS